MLTSFQRQAIVVLAISGCASLLGCQFERRSQDFICDSQADCSGGRICVDRLCVAGDGDAGVDANTPDAAPPSDADQDAFVCPSGCSRCDSTTCVIACDLPDSCATPIVCPAGATCRIECNQRNTCGGGIDCTAAASCRIQCVGSDSCDSPIVCGPGACRVECTGSATCVAGVDCSSACACDTFCAGGSSCLPTPPICPGPPQCDNGVDCSSMGGQCDTCL